MKQLIYHFLKNVDWNIFEFPQLAKNLISNLHFSLIDQNSQMQKFFHINFNYVAWQVLMINESFFR